LEKGDNFFQLISTLFCVVKRGFVEPCKMFLRSKLPCLGWRSADFVQGFLPKMFAGPAKHTRSSTKISMVVPSAFFKCGLSLMAYLSESVSKISVIKKEVVRGGEQTRVILISFIFSFFTSLPLSHSGSPKDLSHT
jgi:hypothetical protein